MGQSTDELTRNIEDTRQHLSRDVDELTDKVSPSRIAERRKQAVKSRLGSARDRVMGAAHDSTDALSSAGQSATGGAADAMHSVESKAQGNPLAAGLVAFGAGMVIASLFPATEAEAAATQRAVDTAKEKGQPLMAEAKSVGQEMGEQLKETATQAAQEVKSTAQESVGEVKQEAQASGEHVKDAAKGQ